MRPDDEAAVATALEMLEEDALIRQSVGLVAGLVAVAVLAITAEAKRQQ